LEDIVSSHQVAYAQKRRSTRIDQSIPLVVQGVGALREPYQEQVSTISISCHGCSYLSKHEVIQGETVYLDLLPGSHGSPGTSSRARVKWAQKTGVKDRGFQIAVELEAAGNIWNLPSPPEDWFPLQRRTGAEPASASRELKVVPRKEQPVSAPDAEVALPVRPATVEAAVTSIPPIAQLMAGLGEQVQTMASQAAALALVKEKDRIVDDFRLQLRNETVKVVQSAVAASREVIVRQAMKELSEAHEAGARNSYAVWRKKLEQDMASAQQHMLAQAKEVSQRLEVVAAKMIERMQHSLENTRSEAVDRFVTRLRDQVAPMLAEAKTSLQKLEASEASFKKESETIYAGLENQLAFSASTSLARVQEELDRTATATSAKTGEALEKLYRGFEKAAEDNVNSLLASLGSQVAQSLEEKAGKVSREYSAGLQDYTRNYLESISKSIAQISQKVRGNSEQ
jgi:hypothetical protein